jgi:hypothetical protein
LRRSPADCAVAHLKGNEMDKPKYETPRLIEEGALTRRGGHEDTTMTQIGTFYTPPENQGQIVEVSYTMIDGQVIRKTYDHSDRSTAYAISDATDTDEGDYWNGEPSNTDWREISAADVQRMIESA